MNPRPEPDARRVPPTGDTVTSRPAIVWVHGGASERDKTSPEIVDEATTFAKKGYVNVSISYRLSPGGCSACGPTPDALPRSSTPARRAGRGPVPARERCDLRRRPDAHRDRGTSAGAITAMNVAYNPDGCRDEREPRHSSAVGRRSRCRARVLGAYDGGTRRACSSTAPTTARSVPVGGQHRERREGRGLPHCSRPGRARPRALRQDRQQILDQTRTSCTGDGPRRGRQSKRARPSTTAKNGRPQ